MRNGTDPQADVAVVGGGLAGLATAAYLARAGRSVTVLERSTRAGGRAMTQDQGGFLFNLGPHALYAGGPGVRVLRELGVPFRGKKPPLAGWGILDGELHRLSVMPWWFATTRLLRGRSRITTPRLLLTVRTADTASLAHMTFGEWLAREAPADDAAALVRMLARVATYAGDPDVLSADVALQQLQLALRGVYYLDGGWQTLVDGLRRVATDAGAGIETAAPVERVEPEGVRLKDGTFVRAGATVIAASPAVAAALVPESASLRALAAAARPVRAACLDIGLRALPDPGVTFATGVDRPLYLSVHSKTARLAPEGGAMVHVAKYQPDGVDDHPAADEAELEGLLDLTQPGWRDTLVTRRFLPDMTVVNALATAPGGLASRPGPEVPDAPHVLVAGDWVGPQGWLSDASLASAKRVAALLSSGAPRRAGARAAAVG